MALTGNANSWSQILEDNHSYTVVKLGFHCAQANNEVDVLKVNAATLTGRTLILNSNTTTTNAGGLQPGELVNGQTSNAYGWVKNWNAVTKTLEIVVANGTFSGTENVAVGGLRSSGNTVLKLDSITTPVYLFNIKSVWYDVFTGKVELEWGDGAGYKTIMTLSGQGYFGENALGTSIFNNAGTPTNNLFISTFGLANNGGYSIVLELSKQQGFAQRPVY